VLGSGLLTGLHVNPRVRVTGVGGLEERCRKLGLNVVGLCTLNLVDP
jgi:hypothetical protein